MKQYLKKDYKVEEIHSAKAVGSGGLDVLSTPSLIAFVENACFEWSNKLIKKSQTTVGVHLECEHIKASKIGTTVRVEAELVKSSERSFSFSFKVLETESEIARGTHKRGIVITEKFLSDI